LGGEDFGLREKAIGGGYGLGIIRLDDGRVIAHVLLDDGPAAQADLAWGAQIIEWNGQPIAEALAETSILWADRVPATLQDRQIEQLRYLVRAPVGTETTLTFQNPDAAESQTVTLVAEDDQLEALVRTLAPERDASDLFKALVQGEVLPSGYGYLAIRSFMPSLGGPRPAKIFERAITSFVEQGVPGIIIDVRGSGGGVDALVPQMAGHFYTTPDFYEYVGYRDAETGQFQIDPEQTLEIEPREPHFAGPVIVLVDAAAMSTAEGLPLVIQRLPQGRVMGIQGTHGSFAIGDMTSDLYRLPEGLAFNFYAGASLDVNETIQVDANADGAGGVVPDVRVPLTEETVRAMYVEGRDVVLEMAIAALDEME
jgi:carboxyl-terminal processing protease